MRKSQEFFSDSYLSANFTQLEVLIKLFQKFAEYEAEPHFNAKASAFANMLQNREALLLDFGQSAILPECREVLRSVTLRRLQTAQIR